MTEELPGIPGRTARFPDKPLPSFLAGFPCVEHEEAMYVMEAEVTDSPEWGQSKKPSQLLPQLNNERKPLCLNRQRRQGFSKTLSLQQITQLVMLIRRERHQLQVFWMT